MRVLVLDMFYQPVRIVSWQRAVCLLYDRKVETVESYEEIIRSPSMAMQMPAVIRQLRKPRRGKVSIKFSRTNVLMRDSYTCQYCGGAFEERDLNYDHVVPRSRGGKTEWNNIVASCFPCNERKANRLPAEAGMKLRNVPRKPAWLPAVAPKFAITHVPDAWRPYLQQAA